MILIKAGEIYYKTQVYFHEHIIDSLPNDDKVWEAEYKKWLKDQGAVVIKPKRQCLTTALGVSPFYDHFGFENEYDATLFLLRWS